MPSEKKYPLHLSADAEAEQRHLESLLDEALEETFPASDPVAINVPHDHDGGEAQIPLPPVSVAEPIRPKLDSSASTTMTVETDRTIGHTARKSEFFDSSLTPLAADGEPPIRPLDRYPFQAAAARCYEVLERCIRRGRRISYRLDLWGGALAFFVSFMGVVAALLLIGIWIFR